MEDAALRNLQLENLREIIVKLDVQGHNLLSLRYTHATRQIHQKAAEKMGNFMARIR